MPDPNDSHIEPAAEMLTPADPGPLAAMEAALAAGPPPEPVPAADAVPADDADPAAPAAPDPVPAPDEPPPVEPVVEPAVVEPVKAVRPSDDLGELPTDVKPATRERFEAMKVKYDTLAAERDTVLTQRDDYQAQAKQWVDTIESTGASPDQFGSTLAYLQAVNSGTPEGLRAAYDMMKAELATLAPLLGEELAGIHDPLAAYPDLVQKVDDTDISREDALEIANARTQRKLQATAAETRAASTSQQSANDAGLAAVAAIGNRLRASDPAGYAAKTAMVTPLIQRIVSKLPPGEWAGAIEDLYASTPTPAPVVAVVPTVDRGTTPLRPTSAPGTGAGLSKQAGSAYEALDMALGSM